MDTQKNTLIKKYREEDNILFQAIEDYKNGDLSKGTLIYEQSCKFTYKKVWDIIEREGGIPNRDEKEIIADIVQEVYYDFFKDVHKFENKYVGSFYSWVDSVAHRKWWRFANKNGKEVLQYKNSEEFVEDRDIWDLSDVNDDDLEEKREFIPETALEDKEFQKTIMDLIQSLPMVQAQTIEYHFYYGMKYQEIADEMGVSLITVKTRMKKAKDSLKEAICDYEKKTGTKLHSVSILPILWIIYRLHIQDTEVPQTIYPNIEKALATSAESAATTVTTTVSEVVATTESAATASVTKAATTAGIAKVLGIKTIVATVATAAVLGGGAIGVHHMNQDSKVPAIELGEVDLGDSFVDDLNEEKQDGEVLGEADTIEDSQMDEAVSNGNSSSSDNRPSSISPDDNQNNGTVPDSENEDGNVGSGSNTETTPDDGNSDSNTENNDATVGDDSSGSTDPDTGDDSGNTESTPESETTSTKGTYSNPYGLGETISKAGVYGGNLGPFDISFKITKVYTLNEGLNLIGGNFSSTENIPIMEATLKITGPSGEEHNGVPMAMFAMGDSSSADISFQWENMDGFIQNNVEYKLRFHTTYASQDTTYTSFKIGFADSSFVFTDYVYFVW